ncbi:hypothetical protein BN85408470 [Alteracholeplasma palmae J233]|uniref:DUF2187 domain-containing protein n=1 Tax=Alteracholeplasma palmae (strain ATCC 49389 / J233) TaxID=1318466 RepID=U4KKV3_ALTPJ|nr:hypothetical protein [Alteracholeplasma palmae]CCV64424.1 hypothetical protein BN85408470 [Alteracholeplasma palmae J233]
MIEMFLNKEVFVKVAFSRHFVEASIPEEYVGTLMEFDESFIKIKVINARKNTVKYILISRKYLISISEV